MFLYGNETGMYQIGAIGLNVQPCCFIVVDTRKTRVYNYGNKEDFALGSELAALLTDGQKEQMFAVREFLEKQAEPVLLRASPVQPRPDGQQEQQV